MASDPLPLTDEQLDKAAHELCRIRGVPISTPTVYSARLEFSRLMQLYMALKKVLEGVE